MRWLKWFLWLAANGMAAFMDFGVGVLITAVGGYLFGVELHLLHLCIGGFLAFLPDLLDVAPVLLAGGEPVGDHHQTIVHRPLVMLPLVVLSGWIADQYLGSSFFWTLIASTCVFYHYVHDMPEFGGGGIAWLWPFSSKYWSFRYSGVEPSASPPMEHAEWIHTHWYRPTAVSIRETGIGTITLGAGVLLVYGAAPAFVLGAVTIAGAIFVWTFARAVHE